MKSILLIAATTITGLLNAQIPNAGFEDWGQHNVFGIVFNDPDGWFSQNFMLAGMGKSESVTATNDAYAGQKAMHLKNTANPDNERAFASSIQFDQMLNITDKFPLNNVKPLSLKGYYKYLYNTGEQDTFSITVMVFKEGNSVGMGMLESNALVTAYTGFEIPIEYSEEGIMPDSALISIYASTPHDGGVLHTSVELFIDELSFTQAATAVGEVAHKDLNASVYPHPLNGTATIQYTQTEAGNVNMELYDITGKRVEVVYTSAAGGTGNKAISWNTDHLHNGMYLLCITAGNASKTIKVVVQ